MIEWMHEELRSLVAAYALRALPPEDVSIVRAHISICYECRAEARCYSGVVDRLAHAVEPGSVPEGFSERVMERVAGTPPGGAAS